MSEKKTFKVANTDITIGNRYTIVGKPDMDAPKGFAEFETSKYLMTGIGEVHSIPFDSSINCYDTSFDEDSASNASIPREERASLVKLYQTNIQKPYETRFKKKLDSMNDDFWGEMGEEGFQITLYPEREFDTSKPKDLLELFQALKKGLVCEKGEKDHLLQRAKYCIVDNNKKQSLRERRAYDKAQAFVTLGNLIKDIDSDDSLYSILEWINFPNARNIQPENLMTNVSIFFDNPTTGQKNCEKFMEAFDSLEKPERKLEMEYFSALAKLRHQNKLEYKKSQWYINKHLLGNTIKAGAQLAAGKGKIADDIRKAIQEELETID